MKIVVCHSHYGKCGIKEYGNQLDRAFGELGVAVEKCSYEYLGEVVSKIAPGDVFLVHYEPALTTPWYLTQYLAEARRLGAKNVLCCHWYEYEFMRQYEHLVDRFVIHREYAPKHCTSTVVPLGCPVYEPSGSRDELRQRFGLPLDKTVLTTIGFLTRWKAVPEITKAMLDAIEGFPALHVHIHTPWPYDTEGVDNEEARTREVMARHGCKWITFSKNFLPEQGVLDLVRASDLGFIYHGFHTNSVSAATKQFVSARRPLVVTPSSHSSDLEGGVVRASFEPTNFAEVVVAVATNPEWRSRLQSEMEIEYARLNMTATATKYLELFESLVASVEVAGRGRCPSDPHESDGGSHTIP